MEITQKGKIVLSLSELESFDNRFTTSGDERRFQCPLPACHGKTNQNFTVNVTNGKWHCMRCQATGLLTEFWTEKLPDYTPTRQRRRTEARKAFTLDTLPKPERPIKPLDEWRDRLGDMVPLAGTPGAVYLAGRGLDVDLCHRAKVKFSPNFCRGGEKQSKGFPAVVFPIVNQGGSSVAASGRAIDGDAKITFGTKSVGVFATPDALTSAVLVITEAPIDALSLATCGVPAVAVTGTDGYPEWLLKSKAFGGSVIAAFDNDDPGNTAAEKVRMACQSIGATMTRLLPPEGFKDWNEALQSIGRGHLTDYLLAHTLIRTTEQAPASAPPIAQVCARLDAPILDAPTAELMKSAKRAARAGDMPTAQAKELLAIVEQSRPLFDRYGEFGWFKEGEGRKLFTRWLELARWYATLEKQPLPLPSPLVAVSYSLLVADIAQHFGIEYIEFDNQYYEYPL